MRTILLSGMICGLFYWEQLPRQVERQYIRPGADGCSDCGDSCGGDCGYPYRWPPPRVRSCDPCGDSCRPMTCHDKTYCGPLTPIFALFTRNCWSNSGCGERYWGDFYGDPPDFCDPCDRCGNYAGGWSGSSGVSYGSRGCNCGGGQSSMQQMVPTEGRVISQGTRVSRQLPTPAAKAYKTTRQ